MTLGSELSLWVAVITCSTAIALAAIYIVAASLMTPFRTNQERRFEQGMAIAIKRLNGDSWTEERLRILEALPLRIKLRIIHRLASVVDGESAAIVVALADQIGLTDAMRAKTKSRFWWNRLQAVRFFASLGSDPSSIPHLLVDSDSWVRAEAISWVGVQGGDSHVDDLLSILMSDDVSCRIAAQESLVSIGKPSANAIAIAISGDLTDCQLLSVLTVARHLKAPECASAALSRGDHESHLVRAAVARTVGSIGVPGSSEFLIEMLDDETIEVKTAACEALGHLHHWPAVSAVSGLLDDENWDVQRAAANALSQLGSPGIVTLQSVINLNAPGWEHAKRALDEAALLSLARSA